MALLSLKPRPGVPNSPRRAGKPSAVVEAPPGPGNYWGETPAQLLKRIEFRIVRRLDGFLFGDYSGLFYGPSLDLAEVREYQPGDEVRKIDWNVTARSGNLHVRQYREEREVRAWLIVDLSSSMAFGTRRVRKEELAFEFAGLTAAVMTRRGNKVGAYSFSEGGGELSPLGSGRRTPVQLLGSLLRSSAARSGKSAGSNASLAFALGHANRTLRRKALVFVVSDFIDSGASGADEERPWEPELRRLALRHEVVAVQVYDPAERELPRAGELRFRDPESGRELWVDTGDPRVRREHARLVAERQANLVQALRRSRVELLEISTARGVVPPVVRFTLSRRGQRQ